MPISLILTPFDYFQIHPSFAVTPNLILEPCLKALCKGRNGPYTLFFCFYDIWTFPGVSKTLIGHIWPLEVPKGCLCMFWNKKY